MDTSFKLVKSVLDDLNSLIAKMHGNDANTQIQKRLSTLSGEYTNLTSAIRNPIDYADPVTRFAYVYSYVGAHSSYIKQRLLSCVPLKKLLQSDDPLTVTCVGGGPGSEMLGLLQACIEVDRSNKLSVYLLDREDGWAETWAELDSRLDSKFKLSTSFRQTDVTSYKTFDNLQKVFSSNIFIMSFFLSEIYSFRDDADEFFKRLVSDMAVGATVLYIDNSSANFTSYAESIFNSTQFVMLSNETNIRILPDNTEQTSDLEPYKNLFSRTPKIQSQVSVRVWRKL